MNRLCTALTERLAPSVQDVQTAHRLVWLEPRQAEYWVLALMLAGLKTLGSRCPTRTEHRNRYRGGYFNDILRPVLDALPPHLWSAQRRKRDYLNHILARAERYGSYQPARQLWVHTANGYYLPNPAMQLCTLADDGTSTIWQSVYEVLKLERNLPE